MTDKQKKEEIKQVVTNLGNIEFTVEDELKFCKEVLKRKEKECEEWKNKYYRSTTETKADLIKQVDQLKAENEAYQTSIVANLDRKISKRYEELLDENNLLKQALREIKEIAEDAKTKVFVDMEDFWEQILQKCEVLDE